MAVVERQMGLELRGIQRCMLGTLRARAVPYDLGPTGSTSEHPLNSSNSKQVDVLRNDPGHMVNVTVQKG
jgi:hypothetical protein